MEQASKVYAFLDTNIFLQYQEFTQIDWRTVLNSKEVCLIVTATNLQELASFKYDPRSKRRQTRSRSVLRKIKDIAGDQVSSEIPIPTRPGVSVLLLLTTPKMEDHPGLQSDVNDDRLIAAILASEHRPAVFVADDTGALLKAKLHGISTVELDESYLLPPEPDENAKRLRKLEEEVARLNNQQPLAAVELLGADQYAVLNVNQSERNNVLNESLRSDTSQLTPILERLQTLYACSPRTRTWGEYSPFGTPLPTRERALAVSDYVQERMARYLTAIDLEFNPIWFYPVDVYTTDMLEPWASPRPQGTDANWYSQILNLDQVCHAHANARFKAIAECGHVQLT